MMIQLAASLLLASPGCIPPVVGGQEPAGTPGEFEADLRARIAEEADGVARSHLRLWAADFALHRGDLETAVADIEAGVLDQGDPRRDRSTPVSRGRPSRTSPIAFRPGT